MIKDMTVYMTVTYSGIISSLFTKKLSTPESYVCKKSPVLESENKFKI